MAHLYLGAEALSLTAAQRQTFIAWLRSLGPASHPSPAKINHARLRLDNLAVIAEAEFDATHITPAALGNRLAQVFGVNPSLVTWTTAQPQIGPTNLPKSEMVTYRYGAQDRLRLVAFAGRDASWGESLQAVQAYLATNRDAWESEGLG